MEPKKKIVILGGGCGALAAAFALTDRRADRARHQVTIYQPGWRLGGKGASGRNEALGSRIEEHGLHIWSGFYENAFWMMRKCYRELDRPASAPMAHVFTAFRPRHYTAMTSRSANGWDVWKGSLPHETGLPGDAIAQDEYKLLEAPLSPWALLSSLIPWALRYLQATTGTAGGDVLERIGAGQWWLAAIVRGTPQRRRRAGEKLLSGADVLFIAQFAARFGFSYAWAERYHRAHPPGAAGPGPDAPLAYRGLARTMRCLQWWAQRKRLRQSESDPLNHRTLFELIDLFATVLIGMLRDNLIERGFDAIASEDFLDWLRRHGAAETTVVSATLTAFYCYIFAYEEGDPERPAVAAGTALRFAFRLVLCSRGAVFWEMMTGMGDAVFAPLYEVLKQRGVRFEFFHRALEVRAASPGRVDAVVFERQLRTKGDKPYDPLIDVRGLPCWPSGPKVELLDVDEAGERRLSEHRRALESEPMPWPGSTTLTLEVEHDFDHLILATSIAPLSLIAPQLLEHDARLRRCVERVKTVPTIAMQLWMTPTTAELGWRSPPPLLTSFGKPLDTWADMSHVLASEGWQTPAPRSVQYFCGALPEALLKAGLQPRQVAVHAAERWLADYSAELFPYAVARDPDSGAPSFVAGVLHDPGNGRGPWHEAQWLTANVEPSERYVQSLPGTTLDRLRADETVFRNLALAGDWLRTGLDYGCVESAVIGGFQAARMVCGYPHVVHGEQDFQTHLEQKEHP